jgi:hypothetical protein
VNKDLDVGAAILVGEEVKVDTYTGTSVLSPGTLSGKIEVVGRLLSPLAESEVGTIRCIGLNVGRKISQTHGHLLRRDSMHNTPTNLKWLFPKSLPSS